MMRWEYVTMPVASDRNGLDVRSLRTFEEQLNDLGQSGWELVGFVAPTGTTMGLSHAVLKRPLA